MRQHYDRLVVFFEGGSRQKSESAGCGWVIYEMRSNGVSGKQIAEGYKYLGYNISKQQATYEGLEGALRSLWLENISCNILFIRHYSHILIKQLKGEAKVHSKSVRPYHEAVQVILVNVSCDAVAYGRAKSPRHASVALQLTNDAIANEDEHFYYSF